MSDNVPRISKDIMRQTINIPEHAESRMCNDPFFQPLSATQVGIRMEECNTACIKVVSESRCKREPGASRTDREPIFLPGFVLCFCPADLKMVIRGCLDRIYNPMSFGLPLPDANFGSYSDNCDRQRGSPNDRDDLITDTCICTSAFCNRSASLGSVPSALGLCGIFLWFRNFLA
jgi:hypothetical protein